MRTLNFKNNFNKQYLIELRIRYLFGLNKLKLRKQKFLRYYKYRYRPEKFKAEIMIRYLYKLNKFKIFKNKFLSKAKTKYNIYLSQSSIYLDHKLDQFNQLVNNDINDNIASKPIKIGLFVLLIFSLVFFVWGAIAPINSASIASGKIVINFNKKTIQHFEGGIIDEILVKENQYVVTGQDLLHLSNIQTKSQNNIIIKQLIQAKATKQRLIAELNDSDFVDYTPTRAHSLNINAEEYKNILKIQNELFIAKNKKTEGQYNILNKRIEQLKSVINGLNHQNIAISAELKILETQERKINDLVKDNNLAENSLLEIQKQISKVKGSLGDIISQIGKNKKAILEIETEIVNYDYEITNQIYNEISEIEINISDLSEQLTAASDTLKRTTIKAPISGHVMDLQFHTKGAVIPPAGEIMYIVPDKEELIIEAKVSPKDIDNIKQGQDAKVSLSSYKEKKVPKLSAKVVSVSADILLDEITGEQYFLARVKLIHDETKKLKKELVLYPGMPAEVFIITGERSLLNYIFSPIIESSYKAFREE